MEIYLLRHGSSLANENRLVCGAFDYPLSNKGVEQALFISEHLSKVSFTKIYTSPLSRAINTISKLENVVQPIIVEQLKELDTGKVSHITLDELWSKNKEFIRPWLSPKLRYPEGENFHEMTQRIIKWYSMKKFCWSDEDKILIVGHEGTLRTIFLYIMNLNLDKYPEFLIENCDYLKFTFNNSSIIDFKHIKFSDLLSQKVFKKKADSSSKRNALE